MNKTMVVIVFVRKTGSGAGNLVSLKVILEPRASFALYYSGFLIICKVRLIRAAHTTTRIKNTPPYSPTNMLLYFKNTGLFYGPILGL
jgi:hypothetical protein